MISEDEFNYNVEMAKMRKCVSENCTINLEIIFI